MTACFSPLKDIEGDVSKDQDKYRATLLEKIQEVRTTANQMIGVYKERHDQWVAAGEPLVEEGL
jgi:hypothetical protein